MAPSFQAGGGGGGGINTIGCDSGSVTPTLGVITLKGVGNLSTTFNGLQFVGSGNAITVNGLFTDNAAPSLGSGPGIDGLQGYVSWGSVPTLYTPNDNLYYGTLDNINLLSQSSGAIYNVFIGSGGPGQSITNSSQNTSIGWSTLSSLSSSVNYSFGQYFGNNVAVGYGALVSLVTGSSCIAIGYLAGQNYTSTESSNICISHSGVTSESNVMRLGQTGTGYGQQSTAYIAATAGVTTSVNDAVPVLISASTEQLGTVSSSIRYKENIVDMADSSSAILNLRPVKFDYKNHKSSKPSYGLIAEEVEKIFPDLVVYKDGQPETLQYQNLPVLLLNEVIKLRKELNELKGK
jgi:hypothetical protein